MLPAGLAVNHSSAPQPRSTTRLPGNHGCRQPRDAHACGVMQQPETVARATSLDQGAYLCMLCRLCKCGRRGRDAKGRRCKAGLHISGAHRPRHVPKAALVEPAATTACSHTLQKLQLSGLSLGACAPRADRRSIKELRLQNEAGGGAARRKHNCEEVH